MSDKTPNDPDQNPNPNPDPNPDPPEPGKDAMATLKQGRIHIIEAGEIVIDGRSG